MTDFLTAAAAMSESPLVRFLAAIALLVGGALLVNRWATRETKRHVDLALAPLTVTDDDFAEYADEAIALTLPLYGSEGAQRIITILAANEAARFDADAVDWTEPARWVQ